MEQKSQSKQPNWLMVAVVTTIVGGVVQVLVNHFDSIVTFLGGTFSHAHLSLGVGYVVNVISALATIGGAIASLLAYRYAKSARQMRSVLRQVYRIASEGLEPHEERVKPLDTPVINREESWKQLEKRGGESVAEGSE